MKKFWKILGLGALAAGLTPYKVEKNEETGEKSYQALLWRITSASGEGEDKRAIGINLGEGTLTSKLMSAVDKAEEPHLFSDELCVEYNGGSADAAEEAVEEAAEEAAEAAEDAVKETVEAVEEAEEAVEEAAEAAEEAVKETVEAVEDEVQASEAAEEPKAE